MEKRKGEKGGRGREEVGKEGRRKELGELRMKTGRKKEGRMMGEVKMVEGEREGKKCRMLGWKERRGEVMQNNKKKRGRNKASQL